MCKIGVFIAYWSTAHTVWMGLETFFLKCPSLTDHVLKWCQNIWFCVCPSLNPTSCILNSKQRDTFVCCQNKEFRSSTVVNCHHVMPYAPVTVKQKNTAVFPHLEVFSAECSLEARLWRRETKLHDSFVYKKMAAVCHRSVRARDKSGRRVTLRMENFS